MPCAVRSIVRKTSEEALALTVVLGSWRALGLGANRTKLNEPVSLRMKIMFHD
jgi:hypothetical protein